MDTTTDKRAPIGVFDSGYGGLTILREMQRVLPDYDYIYLGDNARAPYGSRSFDVVYDFTLQAVKYLFDQGCPLVILACNTASAKALRSIQQLDLPHIDNTRRVLGVIIPTVEALASATHNGHIGVFGTPGTIRSHSYDLEVAKLNSKFTTVSQECPMWVPLVETGEFDSPGADYFVEKYVNELMNKDSEIDTIILGCTHYPLLLPKIRQFVSPDIKLLSQGEIVANSLRDYLQRHPDMDARLSKRGITKYYTTENPMQFAYYASLFLDRPILADKAVVE